MDRKQTAVVLIVIVAVLGTAAFYLQQAPTEPVQSEFDTLDNQFSELDGFLNFENQSFDYGMENIIENWG